MTATSRRIVVGTLIALHLGNNLLWPQYAEAEATYLAFAGFGLTIAQLNLVAVWAALAPGRLMVRLPWSLFLATLIWYAVVLGFRWNGDRLTTEDAVTSGLSFLFGLLVTQVPLWIANRWARWHLTVAAEAPEAAVSERQFSLRHLLAGMTLLGLALGLGRVVLPSQGPLGVDGDPTLLGMLSVLAVCNLIVTVPCIWCAFARWSRMLPLAIGWVIYAAFVSLVEDGVLILLLRAPSDGRVFIVLVVMNVTQCVAVWLTCVVLRWTGFQLVRRPATPARDA